MTFRRRKRDLVEYGVDKTLKAAGKAGLLERYGEDFKYLCYKERFAAYNKACRNWRGPCSGRAFLIHFEQQLLKIVLNYLAVRSDSKDIKKIIKGKAPSWNREGVYGIGKNTILGIEDENGILRDIRDIKDLDTFEIFTEKLF
jgi:hypothetical protein